MGTEIATLGGGCFWCLEAVFAEFEGVERVVSGYSGGEGRNPSYREVCGGRTGHAEVVQVTYDPSVIAYEDLLGLFFAFHDPTTLDRQGPDTGTQYRSAIFFHSPEQEATARRVIGALTAQQVFDQPIVTQVVPLREFHAAEEYHQNYYAQNPEQGYCRAMIAPKVAKLRKHYGERLKKKAPSA